MSTAPPQVSGPGMPRRGRPGPTVALAAVLLVAFVPLFRLAAWAGSITGEENAFEALKGVGALALIEARAPDLQLAPMAPSRHVALNPYGANTFLQLEADPDNVRRSFEILSRGGIGWVRQEFPWEDIEIHAAGDFMDRRHEPQRSAWEKYDLIVEGAERHGIELLVRLDNPPDWAFADPGRSGDKGPPDDDAAFARFVATVAKRYCGRVRYYQIWNEPNIYPEWGEADVDPAGYARLLAAAAEAARGACDDIVIVSAALAPTTEPGGRNMDDLKYLEALYEAGWSPSFDVLAAQGFGLWTGPTDRRASPDRANFSRPMLARDIMVRHGDADKPVWITELGWNSPPAGLKAADPFKFGRTTEEQRARYTVSAFERMQREWPWAPVGFVWFFRRPDWEWHQRPEGYFRMLEPDWQTTLTFEALTGQSTAALQLHWGRHAPSDPAFTFSGPWTEAGARREDGLVGAEGAEVVFPFFGTGFRLVLLDQGRPVDFDAFTVVDGMTSTFHADSAADADPGRAAVPGAPASPGVAIGGLAYGPHVGILRVDGGSLPFAEMIVEGPGPPSPWAPVLRWGLLAAVLVVASSAVLARRRGPGSPGGLGRAMTRAARVAAARLPRRGRAGKRA